MPTSSDFRRTASLSSPDWLAEFLERTRGVITSSSDREDAESGSSPFGPNPAFREDDPCAEQDWPTADDIRGMFPTTHEDVEAATEGSIWRAYVISDHEVIEGWAEELSDDERLKVATAFALLKDNSGLMNGWVSVFQSGLIPAGFLSNLTSTLIAAADRIQASFPTTGAFETSTITGDLDTVFDKYGWVGPIIVSKISTDNPLYKMLWHEFSDESGASEIRKFFGRPEAPLAFTYPLNWTYAVTNGMAAPDSATEYDGFALPDFLKTQISTAADSVALDGWWGRTGLTAGSWIIGTLWGHPVFYTLSAVFKSELEDLSDYLDAAAAADKANDTVSQLLRGAASFWDSNPVTELVDTIIDLWNTFATTLEWALNTLVTVGNPVQIPPVPNLPDKNLLTQLTHDEMLALALTTSTALTGTEISVAALRNTESGVGLDQGTELKFVTTAPTIHLDDCILQFEFTSFERKRDIDDPVNVHLRPTREFAFIADLASVLLEQVYCVDDAVMAVSDLLVNPKGLAGCMLGENAPASAECMPDMLQGVSLARFFAILWRIQVVDAFLSKADPDCLYPAFCWMDTATKRANIDLVVGPLRTDATVTLTDLENLMDLPVVDWGLFPQRYFVKGLLFQLFTNALGLCATWECLTCAQRQAVRDFFTEQAIHCACDVPLRANPPEPEEVEGEFPWPVPPRGWQPDVDIEVPSDGPNGGGGNGPGHEPGDGPGGRTRYDPWFPS